MLKTWEKILIVIAMLIVAFLGGYLTAPERVKKETEIKTEKVEVEKEVVKYVNRIIEKPDGTVIREQEAIREQENRQEVSSTKKVVEHKEKKDWSIKVDYLGLYNSHLGNLNHGLKIDKKIGNTPFSVGVWGINGVGVGLSVGMEF